MTDALLAVDGVTVKYGPLVAATDVSLVIPKGSIVGLIGPNGAGKSTIINAIAGLVRTAGGTITFAGRALGRLRPDQRAQLGMARTFQNLELFASLSVLENVLTRAEAATGAKRSVAEHIGPCKEIIEQLGLGRYLDTEVSQLAYPERKLVEFARATVVDPQLLLLDEPTAGLAAEERHQVVGMIAERMRSRGIGGLVVEHDMSVVRTMCDVVYVMDAGKVIASGTFEEIARSEAVREAYLGRSADA